MNGLRRQHQRRIARAELKRVAATVMLVSVLAGACAHRSPVGSRSGSDTTLAASSTVTTRPRSEAAPPMVPLNEIRTVSPALEKYTRERLLGEVWKRPGLAPRDRSILTLAALIARNQTVEMPYHVNLALDNGVKPREISEIITHLAFYSGWANAMSAIAATKDVFSERNIGTDQLPPASPQLLPLDEAAETQRALRVGE